MEQTIQTENYRVEIIQDVNPYSPREDENFGTMVCFHKRYNLGDKTDYNPNHFNSFDELKKQINKDNKIACILPINFGLN